MDKEKEAWLKAYKKREERMAIPDKVNDRIKQGILQGKMLKEKQAKRLQYFRISAASVGVAIILLLAGLSAINPKDNLPNTAHNTANVDREEHTQAEEVGYIGFEKILEKPITKGNTTVTLTSVIADQEEAIIGYRVSIDGEKVSSFEVKERLLNGNGEQISNVKQIALKNIIYNIKSKKAFFQLPDLEKEDVKANWTFVLDVILDKKNTQTFEFEVPINKEWFEEKSYAVNKTLELGKQKLHIREVQLSPIKTKILVEPDQHNTEQIIAIEDLSIKGEDTAFWEDYETRVTNVGKGTVFMEIPFKGEHTNIPEELFLQISNIYTAESQTAFVLDVNDRKLRNAPSKWELVEFKRDDYFYEFKLEYDGEIDVLENYLGQNITIKNENIGTLYVNRVYKENNKTYVELYISPSVEIDETVNFELIHPKVYKKDFHIPLIQKSL